MNTRVSFVWLLPILAAAFHIYVVYTIVAQPLDVNNHPRSSRSAVWRFHHDMVHRVGPGADCFAVYHAGVMLGRGENPYPYLEERPVIPYFYPFRYLPVVGQTLGTVFTKFSPRMAYRLWVGVMECLLAVLIVVFFRRLPNTTWRVATVCLLLISGPYFLEIHMGQFTFVSLSLLTLAVLLVERPALIGSKATTIISTTCYACAVLLKVLPFVAVPAFVRRRRYVWLLVLSILFVLVVSVPYFLTHPDQWEMFSDVNLSKSPDGLACGNYGVVYLVYLVATEVSGQNLKDVWPDVATIFQIIILGATALIVLVTRQKSVEIALGALVTGHMMTYVDVWEHHYSGVIVIGLLVLYAMTRTDAVGRDKRLLRLTVGAIVLMVVPSPFVLFDNGDPRVWDPSVGWTAFQRVFVVLPKALATVLLYTVCMIQLVRPGLSLPSLRTATSRRDTPHQR